MSRFFNRINAASALAAILVSTLATSSLTPVAAESIERSYGFNAQKTHKADNNKKSSRNRSFSFFDAFSNRKPKKKIRLVVSNAKKSTTSQVYTYRGDRLVPLVDSRLKQPLNRTLPLFAAKAPQGFDPVSNITGGDKLDDSLAQTIFDLLKSGGISTRVTSRQRQAIINFYKARNFKSVWTEMDGVLPTAKKLLSYLSKADEEGLRSSDYLPSGLTGFNDDLAETESDLDLLARFDITLTAMAVRYGQHASGGRIIPNRLSGYHDLAPPTVSGAKILTSLAKTDNPQEYLASLHPRQKSYQAFKRALAALDGGSKEKQYAPIPTGGVIKLNGIDPRLSLIRQRLQDTGLLAKNLKTDSSESEEKPADLYDRALFEAVKEFQKSKRLPADGIIGRRTIAAFNGRTNIDRRNKLILNMERMRWLPRNFGRKYIFVNQASFTLDVFNNNKNVWQTRVVVGRPKNQTSFFIDKMETVVFNPYWGVPQSIITKEMLPRLQSNPGYLDQRGFEVYNRRGKKVSSSSIDWYNYGGSQVPFSVRQPPGARNALGKIKFLFPNKHAIYMHDTPSKSLFSRSSRAFSHGCVRVKNPLKLAENVLGWGRSRIDNKIATGKNGAIRLKQSIPVYITYFTAWPNQQGKVNYFSDVYGRDRLLDRALNTITIASNQGQNRKRFRLTAD